MNYYFDPHARQELKDATLHFSNIDPTLGSDFAEEVEERFRSYFDFPKLGPGSHAPLDVAGHKDFRTQSFIVSGRTDRDLSGYAFIS